MIKGRFVLRTEGPQGLIMYGLNREVLEGEALEPDELLAKIDAVTAEDVQRVAQDLIAKDKLHLAVIGPFEDESRFPDVLAAASAAQRTSSAYTCTIAAWSSSVGPRPAKWKRPVFASRLRCHASSAKAETASRSTRPGTAAVSSSRSR